MIKNKILHLIYIPCTGVGILGYRGDEWLKDRIEIFKKYTLQSLLNQKNKDFALLMSFRPQEQLSAQVSALKRILRESGIRCFLTFDGLMYHDDKFSKNPLTTGLNCARIIRRCWRNNVWRELVPSIRELLVDKNGTLEQRIAQSTKLVTRGTFDWVYLSRIDSDDMFHRDFTQEIRRIKPFEGAIMVKNGYIYNANTGELATWEPKTNPPFHTIIFPADTFFDAKKHLAYYGDFKSHEDIPRVFATKQLGDGMYCVTVHNPKNHISTIWNHPYRGKIVKNKAILKEFGIQSSRHDEHTGQVFHVREDKGGL